MRACQSSLFSQSFSLLDGALRKETVNASILTTPASWLLLCLYCWCQLVPHTRRPLLLTILSPSLSHYRVTPLLFRVRYALSTIMQSVAVGAPLSRHRPSPPHITVQPAGDGDEGVTLHHVPAVVATGPDNPTVAHDIVTRHTDLASAPESHQELSPHTPVPRVSPSTRPQPATPMSPMPTPPTSSRDAVVVTRVGLLPTSTPSRPKDGGAHESTRTTALAGGTQQRQSPRTAHHRLSTSL